MILDLVEVNQLQPNMIRGVPNEYWVNESST